MPLGVAAGCDDAGLGARRYPRAPVGRHLRISRSPQRALRQGARRGHRSGSPPSADGRTVIRPARPVQAFAQGAPQEDDITDRPGEARGAARDGGRGASGEASIRSRTSLRSPPSSSPASGSTPHFCRRVDLTFEELFTNMVKYSPHGGRPRSVSICAKVEGGVEVTLTDYDVDRFDVTQAPDADIDLPIEAAPARGTRPAPHPAARGLVAVRVLRTKAGRVGSRSARRRPERPASTRHGDRGVVDAHDRFRCGRRGGHHGAARRRPVPGGPGVPRAGRRER